MKTYPITKRLGFILVIFCLMGLLFGSIASLAQDEPSQPDDEIPFFEALLSEVQGSSGEGPFGILIDTPREIDSTEIVLNEVSLETLGGTVILWRGVVLGDIDTLQQQAEEGADLTVRRRPENWSLAVSQGIVKVRVVDPILLEAMGGSPVVRRRARGPVVDPILFQTMGGSSVAMVVVAGAQLNFDRAKAEQGINPFEIVPLDTSNADVNNILTSVVSNAAIPLQLSPQQILDLIDSQALLNAFDDLSQANLVVNAILGTNTPQLNGVNTNTVDTTAVQNTSNVIEIILTQTDLTAAQLGDLAANDPRIARILMNSIIFSTGGIDSLIELAAEYPGMIDLFMGLISSDPRAVDMLMQVIAETPNLLDEFNLRASNSPELLDLVVDRLSTNPGAAMLLNELAMTSTNIIEALLNLAALTPDGSGAILLTNTILSSTEASQLFITTLLNNPELMEQFNQILANYPNITTSLVDGLTNNTALENNTVIASNVEDTSDSSNQTQTTFLCHVDGGSGDALVLGLSEAELDGHLVHENDFVVGSASDRDRCLDLTADIATEESDLPENWCSPGGRWDDGRCDDPDPAVVEYMWNLGWYSAALERGEITSMPAEFATPTPVPEITTNTTTTVDMTCYIQVGISEFEIATTAILNGADGGNFEWNTTIPDDLDNTHSGWHIWGPTTWGVGYFGDCSPLGVGGPAPAGLTIIP